MGSLAENAISRQTLFFSAAETAEKTRAGSKK
jgi:hypothetical protein